MLKKRYTSTGNHFHCGMAVHSYFPHRGDFPATSLRPSCSHFPRERVLCVSPFPQGLFGCLCWVQACFPIAFKRSQITRPATFTSQNQFTPRTAACCSGCSKGEITVPFPRWGGILGGSLVFLPAFLPRSLPACHLGCMGFFLGQTSVCRMGQVIDPKLHTATTTYKHTRSPML